MKCPLLKITRPVLALEATHPNAGSVVLTQCEKPPNWGLGEENAQRAVPLSKQTRLNWMSWNYLLRKWVNPPGTRSIAPG